MGGGFAAVGAKSCLCHDRCVATGLNDEHVALHETAARWVDARCPPAVARTALEAETETLPPFWDELADLGWLTLHRDFGLPETAIVLEELGRGVAPGPFLPTVLTSLVLDREVDGTAAVGLAPGDPVLGAGVADIVLLPTGDGWYVFDSASIDVSAAPSLDPTRRVARVERRARAESVDIDGERVRDLASVLFAAELVGVMRWCVDTAVAYAKVREQFGRPIGQFQAVKHRCADMLTALEQARAVAWDAAREPTGLPAAVAGAVVPDLAVRVAKDCIQVLGGIGFTWEHDAHLYLKRAMQLRQLLEPSHVRRERVAQLSLGGARREFRVDLPEEAERFRGPAREFAASVAGLNASERRSALVDSGYLVPHWPKPWGLDAGPLEQLVIDEELRNARVRRPHLQVGAWVLPTLIAHGTPEQQERFIRPTLLGELTWCQLFSEPGAGSDLAALSTKAARVDGGWLITGQKVWTTMARESQWGICLARTNPDVPKHDGITCFLVAIESEGIDIRPLRELTGMAMFNEVFLNDVFVGDDCVVGAVDNGWAVSRTTLANERVSMGAGSSMGPGLEAVLKLVDERSDLGQIGALVAEAYVLGVMGLRTTLRSLTGADPGPEASVRKLLGVEHDQRVQDTGLELLGPAAATADDAASEWVTGLLFSRALTIAGGTSEIQRNVIAERLLGLPKDP